MGLLLARRQERAFERLYRRHVADVYRYALAVLRDPHDAESITQATFVNAYQAHLRGEAPRKPRNWLMGLAHEACRRRSMPPELHPPDELLEDEESPTPFRARKALREGLELSLTCHQAELAVSRQLDGRLPRSQRKLLRAHLRSCAECARFAQAQQAHRAALRSYLPSR